MSKLLTWLSGKKSIMLGLIVTTIAFAVTRGFIAPDTAAYLNAMLTIIFGTASIATTAMYNKLK